MRGAGCTLNDIADREYDGKVARTRLRPLPSGRVSVPQAIVFMTVQLVIGAAVLFSLKPLCWWLGIGVLALIGAYPFMKRITWWPQLFLGLNFNWGALLGCAAVNGSLAWPPILLYLGGIFWTLGYDTIYAHQDKEDDARIGVKSSALALGARTRPFLFGFYAAALALWASAGTSAGLGVLFWAGLAGAGLQLYWQAAHVNVDDPADCLAKFRSKRVPGVLLLVAIAAAKAGAARVTAADIDPFAAAAIALNAALNGVAVSVIADNLLDGDTRFWKFVTTGDICYEQPMAERAMRWLRRLAGRGSTVLLGDPGRAYLPGSGLCELARYDVPTSHELEGRERSDGFVWRVLRN